MKTYHFIISGRVQGVFFRYYTKDTADKFSIKGTVQNLYNGDVEVYAQGNPEAIDKLETFLHSGPPSAYVKTVIKNEMEAENIFPDFKIIH